MSWDLINLQSKDSSGLYSQMSQSVVKQAPNNSTHYTTITLFMALPAENESSSIDAFVDIYWTAIHTWINDSVKLYLKTSLSVVACLLKIAVPQGIHLGHFHTSRSLSSVSVVDQQREERKCVDIKVELHVGR